MVHAYQFPPVVERAPTPQCVHGLGDRGSTRVHQIGDVLLSEPYLEGIAMGARRPEHQGQFAQGFDESHFDGFRADRDQFPFRALLPSFELGAEEGRERGAIADEIRQVFTGDSGYANFAQRRRHVFRRFRSRTAPEYIARTQHGGRQLIPFFGDMAKLDDALQQPKQPRQSVPLPVYDRAIVKI